VKIIGYADDWTIYLAHANMAVIQKKLQDTVDTLENWSEQNGFFFSQTKKVMIQFCRLRQRQYPHVDPKISLKGHDIKLVDSHKNLGLYLKKGWTMASIYQLRKSHIASRRVNILKYVSNVRWGADQDSLLRIHQMLVLSTLAYGSSAYSSARLRNLKNYTLCTTMALE
jgi:hypothetical protein